MPGRVDAQQEAETGSALEHSALSRLLLSLEVVEDPRKSRGKRYPLREVLMIAVLGCMCGCDNAEALEDWGKKEQPWLTQFLTLNHGTPSQDVFLRVLAAIDPQSFRVAFVGWVREMFGGLGVNVQIAIDGQTHRGSADRAKQQKPVHMVHALACGSGLVLGQVSTEEKSNEITAIPVLLEMLHLQGALVSIDAMGTQKKIARQIVEGGGDYLLALKGNQSSLHDQTVEMFEEIFDDRRRSMDEAIPPKANSDVNVDGGHGRIETRKAYVVEDFDRWAPAARKWYRMACLIAVVSECEDTTTGHVSEETRYYISSRVLSAAEANEHVRRHWAVESKLHWCLDVSFGQDGLRLRTGNASENFGVVRHFALNLLRSHKGDRFSIPRRRRLCDYDTDYREQLLAGTER